MTIGESSRIALKEAMPEDRLFSNRRLRQCHPFWRDGVQHRSAVLQLRHLIERLAGDRVPHPVALRRHRTQSPLRWAAQAQPSSFMAQPAFQIFVMWRILSPSNSMT